MCHPVPHGVFCSHTVKETLPRGRMLIPNRLTVSAAGNPPCAQRGQIWYHGTAGEGGSLGQYWYGKHFCLAKSLRECNQLLLIVWDCILSWVLMVCVTCFELERQVYLLLISAMCFVLGSYFCFVNIALFCTPFFCWGCINLLKPTCNNITWSRCSAVAYFIVHIHAQFILI